MHACGPNIANTYGVVDTSPLQLLLTSKGWCLWGALIYREQPHLAIYSWASICFHDSQPCKHCMRIVGQTILTVRPHKTSTLQP